MVMVPSVCWDHANHADILQSLIYITFMRSCTFSRPLVITFAVWTGRKNTGGKGGLYIYIYIYIYITVGPTAVFHGRWTQQKRRKNRIFSHRGWMFIVGFSLSLPRTQRMYLWVRLCFCARWASFVGEGVRPTVVTSLRTVRVISSTVPIGRVANCL